MRLPIFPYLLVLLILFSCDEKTYYIEESNANYTFGNITGKVVQTNSSAMVVVSQVKGIDSTLINPNDGSFEIKDLPIGNYDLSIKADNYRIFKQYNVMVQAAGNTYVGAIDLSDLPDLISSHYPEDKSEIVYNNNYARLTISVIFTQPMDRESVEKAFSTIPPSEGIFHWGQYSTEPNRVYYVDSEANWGYDPKATITTFSQISSFSYQVAQKDSYMDTTYTVNLSTEAKDTTGKQLRFPLKFNFSTIQSSSTQNAILSNPSHGDIDVSLLSSQGIQITFPRNMEPTSTEQAIRFSPESDNLIYIWPAHNQLTIYTGGVLHANTNYDIAVDSTARDMDGTALGKSFHFSFETSDIEINYTSPNNGEVFVSESASIYLNFNTYMQKSTVQGAFKISPSISGAFDWYNDSKTRLVFNPDQGLQHNTKYTITIGTEAKDLYGTSLEEPYSFSFITRPE